MFIHYCDVCNVRVDNDESITVGTKVFCKACAEKQGVRASGSGTHGAKTTGSGTHGTGAARAAGGHASSSGFHGRGAQRSGVHSGPRGTPGTGQRQVATPPRAAPPRSGASSIRPSPAVHAARHAAAPDNKLVVWSLGAAGIVLAVLGVILMSRKPAVPPDAAKTPETPAKVEPVKTDPGVVDNKKPATTPPTRTADNPPRNPNVKPPPEPEVVKPPPPVQLETAMEDIREGAARRELVRLQDYEKDAKANAFELRKRYERYVSTYRSTKPGREAAEHLKTLPAATQRPADTADKAEPGVQAKLFEKSVQGDVIGSNNLKDCKFISTKVLGNIDMPNKGALEATFARGDNLAVQFTGFIEVPSDGTYTFFTTSDDGSLLYIGDTLVANCDGGHGMTEVGDTIPLKKGKHRFRVDYYQGFGDAGVVMGWMGPDVPKQTVPPNVLSHVND